MVERSSGKSEYMMPEENGDGCYKMCKFTNVRWIDLFVDSMMKKTELEKALDGIWPVS